MKPRFRMRAFLLLSLVVLSAGVGCHLWADSQFRAALSALRSWDFDSAELHLSHCARVWFLGGQTRLLQARTARLAGKYELASARLSDCEGLGVPAESIFVEQLLQKAVKDNLAAVERPLLARVMESHPDSVTILEVLVPLYLKNYQLSLAREGVRRWLEYEPDRLEAWILTAQIYERLRATDDAVTSYRRIVELDPENQAARLALAGLLTDGHNTREAQAHFEFLRQRQGDTPAVLIGLSCCCRANRDPDEARRLLQRVIAEHPRMGKALAHRARLAMDTETPEEAEKWFRRAAEASPYERDVLYGLYQVLVRLDRRSEAETVLARLRRVESDITRLQKVTELIAYQENGAEPRCEAGVILIRNGEEKEGVRWLESALRLDPRHAPAHKALAEFYERARDVQQAAWHRQMAQDDTLVPVIPPLGQKQ